VERAPSKIRPRLQLARAVDPSRALSILEVARRMAPEDPALSSEQGRVLLTLGRLDEALAAFGRALALDPADARALNNRGAALFALGQKDAARADFERAITRNACLFDARLNLARMGVPTSAPGCRYTPRQMMALEE
jgi:Flp pilus assembly protein TadD